MLCCQVIRVAVDPAICELESPFRIELELRSKVPQVPKAQWRVRFLADLVHHRLPIDLRLDGQNSEISETSAANGQANGTATGTDRDGASGGFTTLHVLHMAGVPVADLPATALESLSLLEVRLVADSADSVDGAGSEKQADLVCVRLVVDVRRGATGLWQRGVLDPFR